MKTVIIENKIDFNLIYVFKKIVNGRNEYKISLFIISFNFN